MPRGWGDRAFRLEEASHSGNSGRDLLAAHDAETINSHKAQKQIGQQVNRVCCDRYVTSPDGLPMHPRPPAEADPFGESENRECAKARHRSQDQELPRG